MPKLEPIFEHVHKVNLIEEEIAASIAQRLALKKDMPNYMRAYMKLNDHTIMLQKRAAKLNERIIIRSRKIVALPASHRGSLPIIGEIPPQLHAKIDRSREIVEMYVHRNLLPKTAFERILPYENPYNQYDIAHFNEVHDPETAAHEIVHNIETQHPAVLQKSRDFLMLRSAGEEPIKLKDSNFQNAHTYSDDDRAVEDEWESLGGRLYTGRYYSLPGKLDIQDAVSTELLTEGICRLHKNPALFAATDPEYFSFVLNTLRNL